MYIILYLEILLLKKKQVKMSENTKENDKSNKIKKEINNYKPKIGTNKCNLFYKIIKNADIYGAY